MLDKLKSSERKIPGKKKQLEDMLEELRTNFDIEIKWFKVKYIKVKHISSSILSYLVYNIIGENFLIFTITHLITQRLQATIKLLMKARDIMWKLEKIKSKHDYNKK